MRRREFADEYYENVKWRVSFRDNNYPRGELERSARFEQYDTACGYAKEKMECPERYSKVLLEETKSTVTVRVVPTEEHNGE